MIYLLFSIAGTAIGLTKEVPLSTTYLLQPPLERIPNGKVEGHIIVPR